MSAVQSSIGGDAVDYDPFAHGALQRVVPTTEPQREVWLADQLGDEASLAFNEACALELRGPLDTPALRLALQQLVDRHDALRGSVGADGETFCIGDGVALDLRVDDLSSLTTDARAEAVRARMSEAVETPFDIGRGPLFRAALLRRADQDHLLLLTAHHIVCDGWSWWLLVRELGALYAALVAGIDAPAAGLLPPVSFADYALLQATAGIDAQAREDAQYWLQRFADDVPVLDLPLDRPRPPRRTFASAREDVAIDAELVAQVKRLGAQRGASLFATLLAGFATLLSRLSGQAHVVVGIPAAGQSVDGNDQLVGHCVNLLPLRFDIDPLQSVIALIEATQTTLLDAIDHQRLTFGTLLKSLRVDRDPSRLPLVSVMFNIDQALDRDSHGFPGLDVGFDTVPRSYENFELFVNAVQRDGGLVLECQYNVGLFDPATIRRWMAGFEMLLRGAVADAMASVGTLSMLDDAALRLLAALQPEVTDFDRSCAMHQIFERQCDQAPARVALRHREVTWSYAQLDARANRIATLLREHGVHAGGLVGLALDRGPDMLAALLGILKVGAGYVPLDPAFPFERLIYMVGDAGLAALVTQRAHADRFDLRGRPVLALDALGDALAAASPERVDTTMHPESIAYVIYTSGSTGQPKGVQVPHRAVANFITAMQARPGIATDDRLVAVTTLSFDIAVLELLLPLSIGAQVILADRDTAMDGVALSRLIDDTDATLMQATPATWRLLIDAGWRGGERFRVLCGGEPLAQELAGALLERSGAVWNLYGPTETTVWSTCWRVRTPERGISIGTPIANTTVWVLDPQGQACPPGVPGELCIGGDGVTLGYLGRETLTAERFVADPFATLTPGISGVSAPLLYRTGDRGRWLADGTLEHLGRLDYQVKVRGYRIELGEIETVIAGAPGVGQAVVLVREDRPGDVRIVAYVVMRPGASFSEHAVVDAARHALPDYMLPQHVVALAALPLLPNGKIDRKALPAPMPALRDAGTAAPRNDAERAIATAMAQVLGAAEIGIHDNFFALGGHSLLAAQLTSRINRELGVALSLRALFDGPTVAQLAAIVADATGALPPPQIVRQPDQSTAPASLMQERLWMLAQLAPGQLTYNVPSAHRLLGPLDVTLLSQSLDAVVQRQSSLRTSIVDVDGSPVQVIHDSVDNGLLPPIDLTALPADQREAAALAQIDALVHQPIRLDATPMFRARLFRINADEHLLLFMPHHAIWDGWSFDLLYRELSQTYAALERGTAPDLPPLPVSYGDFAIWHRAWIEGPQYAEQLRYWRAHLDNGDAAALRALPTDRPRTPGMSGEAQSLAVSIDRDLVERLHGVARSLDATLFVTLLATYCALIGAFGHQRAVIVGTPVRGRNSDQTEDLMGYFTNLLPLRVAIDPEQTFAMLVRQVRDVVLDGFAHPDVRLEDLMRELSIRDAAGGSVLYHALFSFQDIRQRLADWGSLRHERLEVATPGATEDLGMWFIEGGQGLSGAINYNTSLFDEATAIRLQQRFHAMLESVVADPQQPVARLTRIDDGHPMPIEASGAPHARMSKVNEERADEPALTSAPVSSATRSPVAAAAAAAASARSGDVDDALVTLIASIWTDILGGDSVTPDADFFVIGGHSLQAVQLFHRIGRATGINLPLATLLSASTVRELALACATAGARLPRAVQLTDATLPDPWRPLVVMRGGSDPAPLFFIHAVGGNVLNYRPLAQQMPEGMPVYGLQAFGLDGRTPPLSRIEDMAQRYIDEIRSVQPAGPYQLAGGSMGGMIAYEIAQQLVASGQQVAMLGLIDTSRTLGRKLRREAAQEPSRWRRLRERLSGQSPMSALRLVAAHLRARRERHSARRRVAALRERDEELPHELRYADLERAHVVAYRDYVVQPYPGALTLYRAQKQHRAASDPSLGWQGVVGSLQVFDIPGDHDNIVEAPELAGALRASLDAHRGRRAVDSAAYVAGIDVDTGSGAGIGIDARLADDRDIARSISDDSGAPAHDAHIESAAPAPAPHASA